MTSADTVARPPMWLSLPPGFLPVEVLGQDERARATAQLTAGLSDTARRVVGEALRLADEQARAQRSAHLTLSANGIHPRADGGVDLSTLTAGVVPVPPGPAQALLLTVARAEEARTDHDQVFVQDFAAGTAVVAERTITAPVPDAATASASRHADSPTTVLLRSIRVTLVAPGQAHLAVVELTTRSVDAFDSYRDVMLELIAPSITLEDPEQTARQQHASNRRKQRLADRLGGRTLRVDQPGDGTAGPAQKNGGHS